MGPGERRGRRRRSALVLACVLAAGTLRGHAYHASLGQVEWNRETGKAEIALRLFVDDFEVALSRRQGTPVSVDGTAGVEKIALAYLSETFVLSRPDGKQAPLAWVGQELQAQTVWVYVEADLPGGFAGARLGNALLFELFDDQVNTVNLRRGRARATLVFKPGDAAKALELVEPRADPP